MANVTPMRQLPAAEASYIRGLRACVAMLKETRDADEFFVQGIGRRGPQNNVVRRALDRMLESGDSRELDGFCAALTEICAIANQHGDYTGIFTRYAKRRERVLRRWHRRRA